MIRDYLKADMYTLSRLFFWPEALVFATGVVVLVISFCWLDYIPIKEENSLEEK